MTRNDIQKIIKQTRKASFSLLDIDRDKRSKVLLDLSNALIENQAKIIAYNKKDVARAKKNRISESFINRLTLDERNIKGIADSVLEVAHFSDNLFEIIEERNRPSGILVKKVRVPLGLVGIIYESRPNVTVDAFALTFKSGNAVILKGGKEIKNTNKILIKIIKYVLKKNNVDQNIIFDVSGVKKEASKELLVNEDIDCLIPRGGKSLINFVKDNARVPVIITGASVVHTYVDDTANLRLAKEIIINAKTRRVSVCNALDVLLIHKNKYKSLLKQLVGELALKNVQLRADAKSYEVLKKMNYKLLKRAGAKDFDTEFLDYILGIKVVSGLEEAIKHINEHSLGHSEGIITGTSKHAGKFFQMIDAACLYKNTSTQFSDGGEFGLGSEIGISTQKLHARGPFAHEALTTYKYLIESEGAVRP